LFSIKSSGHEDEEEGKKSNFQVTPEIKGEPETDGTPGRKKAHPGRKKAHPGRKTYATMRKRSILLEKEVSYALRARKRKGK